MKFYIKNNNIYYYHYPIFNGELSNFLVILYLLILIYKTNFISYINYISIFIVIVGISDNIIKAIKHNLYLTFMISILLHCVFLYPLIDMKKYMEPNIINYVLSIVAILIIKFLPYWPYDLSRNNMIIILILINIILTCYYYFHHKYLMF